jgi:hypothetical protein
LSYLLRLFAAGAATAHPTRSTDGRVIPGVAMVGASLPITFSSPVSEISNALSGVANHGASRKNKLSSIV